MGDFESKKPKRALMGEKRGYKYMERHPAARSSVDAMFSTLHITEAALLWLEFAEAVAHSEQRVRAGPMPLPQLIADMLQFRF